MATRSLERTEAFVLSRERLDLGFLARLLQSAVEKLKAFETELGSSTHAASAAANLKKQLKKFEELQAAVSRQTSKADTASPQSHDVDVLRRDTDQLLAQCVAALDPWQNAFAAWHCEEFARNALDLKSIGDVQFFLQLNDGGFAKLMPPNYLDLPLAEQHTALTTRVPSIAKLARLTYFLAENLGGPFHFVVEDAYAATKQRYTAPAETAPASSSSSSSASSASASGSSVGSGSASHSGSSKKEREKCMLQTMDAFKSLSDADLIFLKRSLETTARDQLESRLPLASEGDRFHELSAVGMARYASFAVQLFCACDLRIAYTRQTSIVSHQVEASNSRDDLLMFCSYKLRVLPDEMRALALSAHGAVSVAGHLDDLDAEDPVGLELEGGKKSKRRHARSRSRSSSKLRHASKTSKKRR